MLALSSPRPSGDSLTKPRRVQEQRNSGRMLRECERCRVAFLVDEPFLVVAHTCWHLDCFACAQCFEPLKDTTFYDVGGRMYCEHDFQTLYAPICARCDEFVIGQLVKSVNCSFHSHCFTCEKCENRLEEGVYVVDGRILCIDCNQLVQKRNIRNCFKCKQSVGEEELLMSDGLPYHAYHFNCTNCRKVLTRGARQVKKDKLCERCYDLQCEVCFDCKTAIDPQVERSTIAMGRHWHVEHFRCATCSRPFNGHEHYEKNDKAYCKRDYLELVDNFCFYCNKGLIGRNIHLFGKTFCTGCYRCRACDRLLNYTDKVMELDMRPICKKCMGNKAFQKALKHH